MAGTTLVERREELALKQRELAEIFELAKDGAQVDLSRKAVLEKLGATDQADAMAKIKTRNDELNTLAGELEGAELAEIKSSVRKMGQELAEPASTALVRHPNGNGQQTKTWGQQFVESKAFNESRKLQQTIPFEIEMEVKTLFQTSAGFAIENVRSGLLVPAVTRPIQVIDLIPSFPIGQAAFVYMEETTRTHASAETAEGAAYPESTFVWEQKTSTVRKIADSIPVTDEQLEDEQQVRSLLEQRLSFGLRQRLDGQILVGNGTAPNLRGILNVSGIQTQAKGTDATIVAFLRAVNKVRVTGRADPNGAVFHPNDWLDVILVQNANGDFLFGNPFMQTAPNRLFGISIAISDAETENTGLVGDFANFSRIDDRRGVQVQVGYVNTQFTEGEVTLRADLRVAFTVTRPAAFCTITGI